LLKIKLKTKKIIKLNNNLNLKHIIVTGASSGLGRELSINLSKINCKLFLTGKNKIELLKTYKMLKGDNHKYFAFDLNNLNKLETLTSKMFENDIQFDGFVHCAGMHNIFPLNLIEKKNLIETYNINVFAPLLITKEFAKKNNHNINSSIIYISSVSAFIGSSSLSLYSSSKAAQIGLMKSLAVELSKKKIRVNSISSSFFESKIFNKIKSKIPKENLLQLNKKHLLGIGKYQDIIPTIIHLISDDSQWTTGSNLVIDGGYSSN